MASKRKPSQNKQTKFSRIEDDIEAYFLNPSNQETIVASVKSKVKDKEGGNSCQQIRAILDAFLTSYFTLRLIYYIQWPKPGLSAGRCKWFRIVLPEKIGNFFETVLLPRVLGSLDLKVLEKTKRSYLKEQRKAFTKVVVNKFIAEGKSRPEAVKVAKDWLYNDAKRFLEQHQQYLQSHNQGKHQQTKKALTLDLSKVGKPETIGKRLARKKFDEAIGELNITTTTEMTVKRQKLDVLPAREAVGDYMDTDSDDPRVLDLSQAAKIQEVLKPEVKATMDYDSDNSNQNQQTETLDIEDYWSNWYDQYGQEEKAEERKDPSEEANCQQNKTETNENVANLFLDHFSQFDTPWFQDQVCMILHTAIQRGQLSVLKAVSLNDRAKAILSCRYTNGVTVTEDLLKTAIVECQWDIAGWIMSEFQLINFQATDSNCIFKATKDGALGFLQACAQNGIPRDLLSSMLKAAMDNNQWHVAQWLVTELETDNIDLAECIADAAKKGYLAFLKHCNLVFKEENFPVLPSLLMQQSRSADTWPEQWNVSMWLLETFGAECQVDLKIIKYGVRAKQLEFFKLWRQKAPEQFDSHYDDILKEVLLWSSGVKLIVKLIVENVEPKDWKKSLELVLSNSRDSYMSLKWKIAARLLHKYDTNRTYFDNDKVFAILQEAAKDSEDDLKPLKLLLQTYGDKIDLLRKCPNGKNLFQMILDGSQRGLVCECSEDIDDAITDCKPLQFWQWLCKRFPLQFKRPEIGDLPLEAIDYFCKNTACWLLETYPCPFPEHLLNSKIASAFTDVGKYQVGCYLVKLFKDKVLTNPPRDMLVILAAEFDLYSEDIVWFLRNMSEAFPFDSNKDLIAKAVKRDDTNVLCACYDVYFKKNQITFLSSLPENFLSSLPKNYPTKIAKRAINGSALDGVNWLLKEFSDCFPQQENKELFEHAAANRYYSGLETLKLCHKVYNGIPHASYEKVLQASVKSSEPEVVSWVLESGGYTEKEDQKRVISFNHLIHKTCEDWFQKSEILKYYKGVFGDDFPGELVKKQPDGGNTPLHLLVSENDWYSSRKQNLQFLCQNMHDLSVTNNEGLTAYEVALQKSHKDRDFKEAVEIIKERMIQLGQAPN